MASQDDHRRWAMLVTRNFPPLLGGMERLNKHLLGGLAEQWRMAMCGPAGSSRFAGAAEEIDETEISPLSGFLIKSMWRTWRMAARRRPQWIVAGSGLMAPMAWLAARRYRAKAAVYLHGLDIVAPSVIYHSLWLPFIRRCDVVLVNSRATMGLAIGIGVSPDRISVVNPGTDIPMLDSNRAKQFRDVHGLADSPLLLSVGRLTRRKGLAEFVMRSLPTVVASHPDAVLLVIGDEAKDALHGGGEGERERIMRMAADARVDENIRFLGRCDEDELHAAYEASDIHVFPALSLPGDVEGFGMVALEAAAHGLPSVAFDVGGISDAVEPGVSGVLVASGAYAEFAAQVLRCLGHSELRAEMVNRCRAFAQAKAWPVFTQNVLVALGYRNPDGRP